MQKVGKREICETTRDEFRNTHFRHPLQKVKPKLKCLEKNVRNTNENNKNMQTAQLTHLHKN